jgi:hypothetical protein
MNTSEKNRRAAERRAAQESEGETPDAAADESAADTEPTSRTRPTELREIAGGKGDPRYTSSGRQGRARPLSPGPRRLRSG